MQKKHEKKVAIVTGGNNGIGYGISELLLEEGASVAVLGIDEEGVESAVKRLSEEFGQDRVLGSIADVSDYERISSEFKRIYEHFGKIDYLVNNAGVASPVVSIKDCPNDTFKKVLDVDLVGPFYCMKEALKYMKPGSSIVNISSVLGIVGSASQSPYAAAKHGVLGLTKAAAMDTAKDNIRINALAPGTTLTEMVRELALQLGDGDEEKGIQAQVGRNPMGRVAEVKEQASIVSFLLSDEASYLTGQVLVTDGGQTQSFL